MDELVKELHENYKAPVKHFTKSNLNNREVKEEPFSDSELQDLYRNEINEFIKFEEVNVKTEPLETITKYLNVTDESKEHVQVKEERLYDSNSECTEIKPENVANELNYPTIPDSVKYEETDIKNEPFDSLGVSSIRYAEILKGSYNETAESDIQQQENSVDATDGCNSVKRSSSKFMHMCDVCDYKSPNKRTLRSHMVIHRKSSKGSVYKCTVCSVTTKYKQSLDRHMVTHLDSSEKKAYKCDECDFMAHRKDYLKNHRLIHNDSSKINAKLHKCDQCEYKAKNKSVIRKHELVHKSSTEITMYRCATCTYETKYKRNLNKHLEIHIDPVERKRSLAASIMYTCDVCGLKTRRKYDLNSHMVVHKDPSEVQMYKCTVCDYQTKYKRSLNYHRLTHLEPSEKKMYKCEQCEYLAHSKDMIRKHSKVHRNIFEMDMYASENGDYRTEAKHKVVPKRNMYRCAICKYATTDEKLLQKHVSAHLDSGEKSASGSN